MALKTSYFEATSGRDKGKLFLLTEMPARKSIKWGYRAVIALVNAGVSLPDGSGELGFAALIGVAFSELKKGLAWDEVEPLLDELMDCVRIVPSQDNKSVTRNLIESDIEEPATILQLQSEVFRLHTNFM